MKHVINVLSANSEHRREAEFKFRNISKIDAEVYFYLEKNIPDIFILEKEKLYIPVSHVYFLHGVFNTIIFANR